MNTNFSVRKVTGYDPGYPVGRRRPGRLEARPLRFLFLVVGFLFFFVGVGCGEKEVQLTGVQEYDGDSLTSDTAQPDADDLQGVTDPDFPLDDDAVIPDADDMLTGDPVPDELNELGGAPLVDDELELPDYDDQLAGELMPDADELLSDSDSIVCPVDEEITGVVAPDEMPDYDDQLTGDSAPATKLRK
ncbi:MAG TPA: hypothetical protein P5077_06780 [bacterium]|nr:hypothetical protein [bacterium]